MVKIRKTKNKNLILKLNKSIFPKDPLTINPTDALWVCFLNDFPMGFCTVRPVLNEPGTVFFNRAGLLPKARGRSLHKRLIAVRLAWAKKNNFKTAITYTLQHNNPSANNLMAMGFKLYEPAFRWANDTDEKDCLYFYRDLK